MLSGGHSLNNLNKKGYRLPVYTIIPSVTYNKYILVIFENKDVIIEVKNIEEARNFVKNEENIYSKIIQDEQEIDKMIKESISDIRIIKNNYCSYLESMLYLNDDNITIKFDFKMTYKNGIPSYKGYCLLGENSINIENQLLENTIEEIKKHIHRYILEYVNKVGV